jgi:hypothetical protein
MWVLGAERKCHQGRGRRSVADACRLGHFKVHFGLPSTTLSPVEPDRSILPRRAGRDTGTMRPTQLRSHCRLLANTCRQVQTTNPHSLSASRKTSTSAATYHSTLPRHASGGIDSQSPTSSTPHCRRSAETICTALLAVQEHARAEDASISISPSGQRLRAHIGRFVRGPFKRPTGNDQLDAHPVSWFVADVRQSRHDARCRRTAWALGLVRGSLDLAQPATDRAPGPAATRNHTHSATAGATARPVCACEGRHHAIHRAVEKYKSAFRRDLWRRLRWHRSVVAAAAAGG